MAIHDTVVSMLKVKLKPRQDGYTDQFTRIFQLKIMFVGALFTGMAWYSGGMNCLSKGVDGGFIGTTCWINGVYIYEEVRNKDASTIGYYGIPDNINFDGKNKYGAFCSTQAGISMNGGKKMNENCKPLKKTFFLQYQYMTFLLVALGAIYYAPYPIFKFVNSDMEALKTALNDGNGDKITETFFNSQVTSSLKMHMRIVGNILIKVLYIVANVACFLIMDTSLGGRFRTYGSEWAEWSKLNNSIAYDYMGKRLTPKPGDVLLPSFALCDVHELAKDKITAYSNTQHVLCEMNEHILYQYVLVIVWWVMVAGLVVSVIGLLSIFFHYAIIFQSIRNVGINKSFNVRECEYLDFIRRKNMPIFGHVMRYFKEESENDLLSSTAPSYQAPPPLNEKEDTKF